MALCFDLLHASDIQDVREGSKIIKLRMGAMGETAAKEFDPPV